jgi:glycine betaine/proline transport system substrate-binding protein
MTMRPLPASFIRRRWGRWGRRWGAWLLLVLVTWGAIAGCQRLGSSAPKGIVRSAYGALGELFQTEIINEGLEALGYQVVEGLEIEYDIIHESVARGYLEFTASHWHRLHQDYFAAHGDRLARVGDLVRHASQGYLVDRASGQQGITQIDQLQDPAIARRFDVDGDGKADLFGCDRGWGCHAIIEHHLDAYGLRDTVTHVFGEYDDQIKNTVMPRIAAGQPVLYYTWNPYWVSGALEIGTDVDWLTVPYTSLPGAAEVDPAETTVEGQNLGFAVDKIQVLANQDFLAEHPDIARFLEMVQISPVDISQQNHRMVQQGEASVEDIRRHAQAWIDAHRNQFDFWLYEARKAVSLHPAHQAVA